MNESLRAKADEVLAGLGSALKAYRTAAYRAIQTEFLIETFRNCGLVVADPSSPLIGDIIDIFQSGGGGDSCGSNGELSDKERKWIEWGILHKDFLVGLGNPASETNKKRASIPVTGSTDGASVSVRIKRIEDEDLLLVRRLYSAYHFMDKIFSSEKSGEIVKSELAIAPYPYALNPYPEHADLSNPSRAYLFAGSELGARLAQVWLTRYGVKDGYIGPGTVHRVKTTAILPVNEVPPPVWDERSCRLCGNFGDQLTLGVLIPADCTSWVHSECLAWSIPGPTSYHSAPVAWKYAKPVIGPNSFEFQSFPTNVYNSADVVNLISAHGESECSVCGKLGATVHCQSCHTAASFHLPCAIAVNCASAPHPAPRVLMDSKCRLLTCGKCLYRHPENERIFTQQFTAAIQTMKASQSAVNQVWAVRHVDPVRVIQTTLTSPPTTPDLVSRTGPLTIVNPGGFPDNFVYDGSARLTPRGFASVRLFWIIDLTLTGADEVSITASGKETPVLKKRRRVAYLNRISGNGKFFSIQVIGGRVVAVGTSLDEVWAEFRAMLITTSDRDFTLPSSMTGEWFFGLTSEVMRRHHSGIAMRSVKKQAGLHREAWLYHPQLRDFITEALGLKSDLKPVTSIRRNLASRIETYKAGIDQLRSLGREAIGTSATSGGTKRENSSDLLEPALVLPEWANVDEGGTGSGSSKPSRVAKTGVSEIPALADTWLRYKVRSAIADIELLAVKRSVIHNYGLFSRNGFTKGEMVVEYQGEVLRQTIADEREKKAEREGDGDGGSCYMFKLDDDYVVDATLKGNCARFINHSCNPNCTCKMIEDENRLKHIMIIAKRDIAPGEEITYDYQFAVESEKLACLCGAPNCLGRLN